LKRILIKKPWDHVINLKEDFVPRKGRTYLMLRQEKEEVKEFVKKQLRKGYIRFSKLPQTLLVFFISQTLFGHISINYLTILTVSMAMESPQKTF